MTTEVGVNDAPPRPGTEAGDAYWANDICGDQGRCGRPKTEPHKVHVWYDKGCKIISTWPATD